HASFSNYMAGSSPPLFAMYFLSTISSHLLFAGISWGDLHVNLPNKLIRHALCENTQDSRF
ncbi:MAG: hypothetical protein II265_09160, partial [Clostridia bacterium]|nr:hypothetical protein [Clostridia bacterium]